MYAKDLKKECVWYVPKTERKISRFGDQEGAAIRSQTRRQVLGNEFGFGSKWNETLRSLSGEDT